MSEPAVRIENLTRTFRDLRALDGVSFEIHHGEIFGFIGPNGAGKTTTLRILATLDDADDGDVYYSGISALEVPDLVRPKLGFVPDRQGVYTNLTVAEYLEFFARAYRLEGDARRTAVGDIIEFAGLSEIVDRKCTELSKGMRQRLSFARALVHDPEVLLLDEPMEGLDPRARIEFRELLVELARAGKAVLISSHILTELAEFVDRVAILERGRLAAYGRLDDLAAEVRTAGVVRLSLRDEQDAPAAERFLAQLPGVRKVVGRGVDFRLEIDGELPEGDRVVHDLVVAGFRVDSFDCEEAGLEDLFMRLTRGEVA